MNRKCLLKKGLAVLTSLSMSLGLCISGNAAVPLDTVTVSAEEDVEEEVALGEINGTEEPEPDSGIRQATISDALYDEDGDLLDGEVIDVRRAVDEVVDLGRLIDAQVVEHVVARLDDVADAQELLRVEDVFVVRLAGRDRQMVLFHVVVVELVRRRVAEDREHAEDTGGQDFHHRLERVDERGAVMGRRDGRDGGDHIAVAALEQRR